MTVKLPNEKREKAARMLAEDRYSDIKIAELCGISESSLQKWKHKPDFAGRVKELVAAYADRALKQGLARKERRIAVLAGLHDKLLQVIDERAEDPEFKNVPGGTTGVITKHVKGIGKGEDFQVVEVYEVDTGTIREVRELQEQIAEELGQRIKKSEVRVEDLSLEELDTQINELLGKARGQDEKPDRKPTWTN